MGFVRTRITDTHSPSPRNAGVTCGVMSVGRAGSVVVVVVVVVVSPGTVELVVVVEVVVVVGTAVVVGSIEVVVVGPMFGQLAVRTRDVCCAGAELPPGLRVVVEPILLGTDDVGEPMLVGGAMVSCGGSVSAGRRANVSAGAAAGGSL